jgi:flavorubredoxin
VPSLPWTGMFAYDAKSQKLFSSKFFGAHVNTQAATDAGGMPVRHAP